LIALPVPRVSTDQFGDLATLEIETSLYGEVPVFKAAYWFTDRFFVHLRRSGAETIMVELRHKGEGTAEELSRALSEFCNSLIDFKLRQVVLGETGAIREALVSKAFSEGLAGRRLGPAVSGERALPEPDDSYREDSIGAGRH
jgi:His-Xaa-Ser system protein HxsD